MKNGLLGVPDTDTHIRPHGGSSISRPLRPPQTWCWTASPDLGVRVLDQVGMVAARWPHRSPHRHWYWLGYGDRAEEAGARPCWPGEAGDREKARAGLSDLRGHQLLTGGWQATTRPSVGLQRHGRGGRGRPLHHPHLRRLASTRMPSWRWSSSLRQAPATLTVSRCLAYGCSTA